jgi:hypothetical protein
MALDARQMRGMEIANTIGNRSAVAVSIKRLELAKITKFFIS